MNVEAILRGFYKRADEIAQAIKPTPYDDVRPPIPVSNPQPNITNLGKGIFHANTAMVVPNAVGRHLPLISFSGNAKFPINPNRPILNMDSHGGGPRDMYSLSNPFSKENKGEYSFNIPNIAHNGSPWGGKAESLLYNPPDKAENIGKDISQFTGIGNDNTFHNDKEFYYNHHLLNNQQLTSNLQDKNPNIIKSLGCNSDNNGCTPDMYANWVKQLHTTINGRKKWDDGETMLIGGSTIRPNEDPITKIDYPNKETYTPTTYSTPKDFKVNLDKVIMTPPGNYSWTMGDSSPILTDTLNKLKVPIAAPHEFNLIPGSDPTAQKSWLNDGVYTDARRVGIPEVTAAGYKFVPEILTPLLMKLKYPDTRVLSEIAGGLKRAAPPLAAGTLVAEMAGEAGEIGQELGKGNNYLDKMQAVNTNPYTSYKDKVMANMSRPIGSIVSYMKEEQELKKLMLDNLKDKIFNR